MVAAAGCVQTGEAIEDAAPVDLGNARRRRRRRPGRRDPPSSAALRRIRPSGSVWTIALRRRLRSAWVRRSGSASTTISGTSPNSSRRSLTGRIDSTSPARNSARSMGCGRRKPASSARASRSRSSTSRFMRSISARAIRSTRRTSVGVRIFLHGQDLELAAEDRQRRPQLVRGVGQERGLPSERLLQRVEHLVERPGQDADLVVAAAELHPRTEVALLDPSGDARHPAQRRRRRGTRRASLPGARRACRARRPGGMPSARCARRARSARWVRRRRGARSPPADGGRRDQEAHRADARQPSMVEAWVGREDRVGGRALASPLGRAVVAVALAGVEELRLVRDRLTPRRDDEDDVGGRPRRLARDLAARLALDVVRRIARNRGAQRPHVLLAGLDPSPTAASRWSRGPRRGTRRPGTPPRPRRPAG